MITPFLLSRWCCVPSRCSVSLPRPKKDGTILTTLAPDKPVRTRMPVWPRQSSFSQLGRRGWTGATLAGWLMERSSTQSQNQVMAVGVWVQPQGCGVMGSDTTTQPIWCISLLSLHQRSVRVSNSQLVNHHNHGNIRFMMSAWIRSNSGSVLYSSCLGYNIASDQLSLDNEWFYACFRKCFLPQLLNKAELHRGRPGMCQSWKSNRQSGPDLRSLEANGTRPLWCWMVDRWKCRSSNHEASV